jgi:hypothetical protein
MPGDAARQLDQRRRPRCLVSRYRPSAWLSRADSLAGTLPTYAQLTCMPRPETILLPPWPVHPGRKAGRFAALGFAGHHRSV